MSPDTWSRDLDGAEQAAREIDAWLAGDALDDMADDELSEPREAADDECDCGLCQLCDDSDPGGPR